jgi:hypothetical protein
MNGIKLTELDAHFLKISNEDSKSYHYIDDINQAQGIFFLCPLCFRKNNGPIGTHGIICWFQNRGVPDEMNPKPGRWNLQGTGLNDLTFVPPKSVSVKLTSGCGWHGFIRNGEATNG